MVKKVESEADYEVVKDAYYQYLGNRNLLDQKQIDEFLMKALDIGKPELAFELIKNHAELLSHPNPNVLQAFLDHFKQ